MSNHIALDSIPDALAALGRGAAIIVVDDEDRENEGDFVVAADAVTPDVINFLVRHGRGLVCLAATRERLRALDLRPMVVENTAPLGTSFTVSVDAAEGVTTGISAHDRARTVQVFIDAASRPAGCCSARGTPRRSSISVAWPASTLPGSSAKSWTRTAAWPGFRACGPLPMPSASSWCRSQT
jgi:hypothetical protein